MLRVDADEVLVAAGHRPRDIAVDEDDPRFRITALVRRVNWTPEREYTISRALNGYIEFDRKESQE